MTALEEWQAALAEANETARGRLLAGGEFTPEPPPEYDPVTPLVRAWLTSGRGAA